MQSEQAGDQKPDLFLRIWRIVAKDNLVRIRLLLAAKTPPKPSQLGTRLRRPMVAMAERRMEAIQVTHEGAAPRRKLTLTPVHFPRPCL
jgi:hypothetical protein